MKYLINLLLVIICLNPVFAQEVGERGINYQAVLRDAGGEIMAKRDVALIIEFYSGVASDRVVYSELHYTKTNQFGLVNIVLGEGNSDEGAFELIPWSTEDIYLRLSLDMDNTGRFVILTDQRMLSVPYAMHAGTASELSGDGNLPTRGPSAGQWSLAGNKDVFPESNWLGTNNYTDLIIKTNRKERLRVDKDGTLFILEDIYVKAGLNVSGDVMFYDLNVQNNLTVGNVSMFTGPVGIGTNPPGVGMLHVKGDSPSHVAFFENENGSGDGIGIQIRSSNISGENNFTTYYDAQGNVAGRVEGFDFLQDFADVPLPSIEVLYQLGCLIIDGDNPIIQGMDWLTERINDDVIDLWNNDAEVPSFAIPDIPHMHVHRIKLFGGLSLPALPDVPSIYFPHTTVFNGLTLPDIPAFDFSDQIGSIPEIPAIGNSLKDIAGCPDGIPSAVTSYLSEFAQWASRNNAASFIPTGTVTAILKPLLWVVMSGYNDGGVTYGSKGADYAEYLERVNPELDLMPGEIVGVFGGKISKSTEGADQILAISSMPVVLGNQPEMGKEDLYEKVGFLGQVPVFVKGKVEIGDYILPSGENDGVGYAVRPGNLSIKDLSSVLGKAWSDSDGKTGLSLINVSIGLRPTELSDILTVHENRISALETRLDQMGNN